MWENIWENLRSGMWEESHCMGSAAGRRRSAGSVGTFAGAVVTLWFTFSETFSDWFSMWVFVVGFVSSVVFSLGFSFIPKLELVPGSDQDHTFWAVVRGDSVDTRESEEGSGGSGSR